MASILPVWGQNYLTGPNTGAESRLDNTPRNVTFPLTVTGSGTYSLSGGIFFMKDGPGTIGNVTLTVKNSAAMALGSVTLSNSQFCAGLSGTECQSYAYHTFTLAPPLALSPGSYTLVLSTDAMPQQDTAYFVKGGGTSFSVMAGLPATPNLTISKSVSPANLISGMPAAYRVTVTNIGNAPTSGTITVTDTLGPNQTLGSPPPNGSNWNCSAAGQVVTCTTSVSIPAGASASPITITVNVAATATISVTNTVTVAGGGGTNTNNSFTLVSPVNSPNLSVLKTASAATFIQGQNEVYTITASNAGNAPSSGTITVTDTLDSNLTFVSATGSGWSCSNAAQVVTCTTSASIAAGAPAAPITITVSVAPHGETSVTNTAAVTGGGGTNTNNSFTLVSPVTAPNLSVSKTAGPFSKGQNAVYTILVSNGGTAPSSGVITVTDTLDPNLTFVSATGSGWSCNAAAQVVTCTTTAAVAASGSAPPITLTVKVSATAPATVTNNVTVGGGGSSNNSSQLVSAVDATNLTISKTANPATFTQGQGAVYTITASNIGNAPSAGTITVTDTLDPNLTFVSATGSGWSCGAAAQVVTCTTGAVIAAGASASPIMLTVNVASNGQISATNMVTISGGGDVVHTNTSFTLVSVVNGSNLSVSKTANPATFTQGQNGAYTITARNIGNAPSAGTITVTDTLDPNLTFVSFTGTGWMCSATGHDVTCTTSTVIAAGASAPPITISVNVGATAPTSVTNNVTVAGGGGTNTNNSFQLVSNVGNPNLSVSKTASPATFTQGQNGAYTITARNVGNGDSSGTITVKDTLDSNLTFVSATGSGWSCSAAAQLVTCTTSAVIAAGASGAPITITVNVVATAPASVTNNVTVAGGGGTNTNNSFQLVSTVNPPGPPSVQGVPATSTAVLILAGLVLIGLVVLLRRRAAYRG
jgi:uncharacterized repeat protein (TIGR01451 family)